MGTFEGGGGSVIDIGGLPVIDVGGGDEFAIDGMYLGTGGGDGVYFTLDAPLAPADTVDIYVPRDSRYYSPSRVTDHTLYSQEGGHLVVLEAIGLKFPDGDYRVDIVREDNSRSYPTHKPGCNSAIFGGRQACRPLPGNRKLLFALPAAPTGEYRIKLTMPDLLEVWSVNTINLTFVPESRVFRSLCRFPFKVMRPSSPIQEV